MVEENFLKTAIQANALRFGTYRLKSGRISPYFFNAGFFCNGRELYQLATCYAEVIIRKNIDFDLIFGPAYKGIPLAATVCAVLFEKYGKVVGYCYNRKEKKMHGEGGLVVGCELYNKKVLIIDDVITAGTAVTESIEMLQSQNAIIVGIVLALDRQEFGLQLKLSAVQVTKEKYRLPIFAIATLEQLIKFIQQNNNFDPKLVQRIQAYQALYSIISNN